MASKQEQELMALEKKYWQAIKDGDINAAVELTDFPCIVTGPQGVGSVEEKAFKAMMKSSNHSLDRFELSDIQVRLVGDDVAVVAYKAHEDLTVDGELVELDVADSSTWIRRKGRWLCAAHTESVAGDPFGRDRQTKAN